MVSFEVEGSIERKALVEWVRTVGYDDLRDIFMALDAVIDRSEAVHAMTYFLSCELHDRLGPLPANDGQAFLPFGVAV